MPLIRAAHVLPMAGALISDGAVVVEGAAIQAVGRYRTLQKAYPLAEVIDLGHSLLAPGLINAHTHLELSGPIAFPGSFIEWIELVGGQLRHESDEPLCQNVSAGLEQSIRAGVTTLADICASPAAMTEKKVSDTVFDARRIRFLEIIAQDLTRAEKKVTEKKVSDTVFDADWGLSPHAPYSTSRDVYEWVFALADRQRVPLVTHLAELREEVQFCLHGDGPWADYWQRMRPDQPIPIECPHMTPVRYFLSMSSPAVPVCLAHVNYLDDEELSALAQRPYSVAYCPRSHAYFGHEPHRFQEMLDAGINVCLGTDSLASNHTLSIWDEMRFLGQRHPDIDPLTIWRMATVNGARALGLQSQNGQLTPGRAADMVAIGFSGNLNLADLWHQPACPAWTMINGRVAHDSLLG